MNEKRFKYVLTETQKCAKRDLNIRKESQVYDSYHFFYETYALSKLQKRHPHMSKETHEKKSKETQMYGKRHKYIKAITSP